jgi:beta-glucanase (GH16 family)
VVWYFDGGEVYRVGADLPHQPMYIIANLAVGGNWPGSPDETTVFPAYFDIDYIRVYRDPAMPTPTPTP